MFRVCFRLLWGLACLQLAHGEMLVSPNSLTGAEGGFNNVAPFGITPSLSSSARYQQVYAASEFSNFTQDLFLITQIAFRPDSFRGTAFSSVLPDIQINLSTTTASPENLSATYSVNVGLDDTIVFPRGPLAISSMFVGPKSGPKDFDIVMDLATPFFYQPGVGNLLLDVRNFGAGIATALDAVNVAGDSVSRVSAASLDGVNDTEGRPDTLGLVTRFTLVRVPAVPEPGVLSLIAAASFTGFWLKRRLAVGRT
ncbi:MAG: hypothetical protein EXS31_17350 [Pedosphaera sp.]|nr:hypothetical protein [Pedosphaera sp.]